MEKQRWGLRRLVLVPCPFQGHINPMLQLGTLLHANGFSITVAHTKFNFPNPDNHPDFTFLQMLDALFDRDASSMDITDVISCLNISCKAPLQKSLTQIIERDEEDHSSKLPCIVYDGSMYFAEAVAHELELPSIMFRTTSAATMLTYYSCPQLQKEGYIPLQDATSLTLVPGLHPLRFKDLPIVNFKNLDTSLQQIAKTRDIRSSSAVICNTIDCLERSSLAQLQQQCKVPVFPIGPLHFIVPTASSSLLKEDRSCIDWLDKQTHNSVLYVSLGSIASMNQNEIREMAKGLSNSRQPFLWVLRPGSLLPKDFNEIIGGRGLIVKWAPQKEVLVHKAIGGFWSHCGWNSTLESICAGVAMICQPRFGDQRVNARLVTDVWKVGFEMDNNLVSIEIEKAIRRLMLDEEGHELRRRFWHSYSKHPIFHGSLDLIHLGILSPGTSALNTCASGVSFQSIWVLTKAEVSGVCVVSEEEKEKGKFLKGSQTSREKGSKTLLRRLPEKLGIRDIFGKENEMNRKLWQLGESRELSMLLLVWVLRAPEMEFYRICGGFSIQKIFLGHYPETCPNDETKTLQF
ncbi:hypothetical protein CRYUN_Cryun02cG0183600 [Craigia yunnanensis]